MATKEAYMLSRDRAESERLNVQHDYMRDLGHGHLVHPLIDTTKIKRIADVGTGTGIWLWETAQELFNLRLNEGEREFVGFDISPEQFQPESYPIIGFVIHDIVQPFPEEYRGKFDLVHIRLLSYALKAEDLRNAVENIVSLLRPGGFLQWEECDAIDCWAVPETPRTRAAVFNVISERVARGLTPAIVTPLVKTLQSLTLPLQDGTFSPLAWTSDLMRIMQLETIATTNHRAPLVNAMKQDQILSGAVILNQAGISRRLACASDPNKTIAEVEQLKIEVAQMEELIEAIEQGQDPACSNWDMEMTRILARKVSVASRDGEWMSVRRSDCSR